MSDRATRVFFVGFNRTGTRALTALMARSGLVTLHWGGRDRTTNAAYRMLANVGRGRPILSGMEHVNALADLTYCESDCYIEGVRLFREMHHEHPDATYVLNTRDREDWLASRFAFASGAFAARAGAARGLDPDGLAAAWRAEHDRHESEVLDHFTRMPGRFLRFDIDRTPIAALVDVLAPDVHVDPSWWRRVGGRRT